MSKKSQYVVAMTLSVVAFLLLLVNFSLGASNRAKSHEILNSQTELEMARMTNSLYEKVVVLVATVSLRSQDQALLNTLVNANIDVSGLNKTSKDSSK